MNPETTHRQRKSIRLKGYDYAQAGLYFVTICTENRACLFGEVVDDEMVLNQAGQIVMDVWSEIPNHSTDVDVDAFVVMPNHVHGVIVIMDTIGTTHVGATHASPLPPRGPKPRSIGAIVGSFKSAVSKRINENRTRPGAPVWQRNYYEHIIRNDNALERIREYIDENPFNWGQDAENPMNQKIRKV